MNKHRKFTITFDLTVHEPATVEAIRNRLLEAYKALPTGQVTTGNVYPTDTPIPENTEADTLTAQFGNPKRGQA